MRNRFRWKRFLRQLQITDTTLLDRRTVYHVGFARAGVRAVVSAAPASVHRSTMAAATYKLVSAMRNRNFELPRWLRRKLFALRILNRYFCHRKFISPSQIPVRIANRYLPQRDAKKIVHVPRNLIIAKTLPNSRQPRIPTSAPPSLLIANLRSLTNKSTKLL